MQNQLGYSSTHNDEVALPQGISNEEIDHFVQQAMKAFKVPGSAVGVVRNGSILHAKGYGVRELSKTGSITPETLFAIGSVSKSFTSAALAMLVDDGAIKWCDRVIDYMPDFRLYDPWVTHEFRVKDLLIHNSGLGVGAGDLMFWPTAGFSREEIVTNLRHLKPVSSFRSQYAYDNLLYIVAGELIPAITRMSFEDFVDKRILQPLGMQNCVANRASLKDFTDIAEPHVIIDGSVQVLPVKEDRHNPVVSAAAGGLYCNISGVLRWLNMHLNGGLLPDGAPLLSTTQLAELHTPHTVMPVDRHDNAWFKTHFMSYGLGWALRDIDGHKCVSHTGSVQGMVSYAAMLPELDLGIAVLVNQHAGSAIKSIMYNIINAYTANTMSETVNWIARFQEIEQQELADAENIVPDQEVSFIPDMPLHQYCGLYSDPWLGDAIVTEVSNQLYMEFSRAEKLKGTLVPYKENVFIARWDDRSLDADAYVKFDIDFTGKPQVITMKAVSPLTDFSFDFHDLNLERISK